MKIIGTYLAVAAPTKRISCDRWTFSLWCSRAAIKAEVFRERTVAMHRQEPEKV